LRRAPPLQGGGRRFEPCSAHSLTSIDASGRLSDGARQGNTANRLQTSERAPNRRASPQMIDDVAASIGRLRHMLDGTVRFATNYDSGPPAWQGTPGSVVAGELAEAPTISLAWETAVRTVLSGLRLQLFTVSRHLKSISNLLATEMPPFGPAILARSALETAARAWWLVDSQIEMRRRVARGLTDRLYSADYAAALAGSTASVIRTSRSRHRGSRGSVPTFRYASPAENAIVMWVRRRDRLRRSSARTFFAL
jgi:hypothetical protein